MTVRAGKAILPNHPRAPCMGTPLQNAPPLRRLDLWGRLSDDIADTRVSDAALTVNGPNSFHCVWAGRNGPPG